MSVYLEKSLLKSDEIYMKKSLIAYMAMEL